MADLEALLTTADITRPGAYPPSQTALLLLDFHDLFVNKMGGPLASAAVETASQMRSWAKSQGMPIVHALVDIHSPPYPTCKDAQKFSSICSTLQQSGGDEHSALTKDSDASEVTFVRAPGFVSTLKSPGMEAFLKEKGIKSLILTGLSTSGCVLRTVMAATDAEFVATVLSDGCADGKEGMHDSLITGLIPSRAYVVTAEDFRKNYRGTAVAK